MTRFLKLLWKVGSTESVMGSSQEIMAHKMRPYLWRIVVLLDFPGVLFHYIYKDESSFDDFTLDLVCWDSILGLLS